MIGLEAIVGLEKMTIHQCQRLAEKIGFDKATFDLCGPKGKLKAKWLDAYMGIFQIVGQEGFVMTRQFEFQPDVWCENLMVEEPSPNAAGGCPKCGRVDAPSCLRDGCPKMGPL